MGKGTTFYLTFPIRCEQTTKTVNSLGECVNMPLLPDLSAEPTDSLPTAGDESPHLLIIEDNPDIVRYIGNQLTGRYALSYAANGGEGLKKAEEMVSDLIVTT